MNVPQTSRFPYPLLPRDVVLFTAGNNHANKEGEWHINNREQQQLSFVQLPPSAEVFGLTVLMPDCQPVRGHMCTDPLEVVLFPNSSSL